MLPGFLVAPLRKLIIRCMENEDEYPTAAEQLGFSGTYDVVKQLVENDGYDPVEVDKGVLIAAISCFRRRISHEEIAKILYEHADLNAIRDRLPDQE